jgi:hypothetical protein
LKNDKIEGSLMVSQQVYSSLYQTYIYWKMQAITLLLVRGEEDMGPVRLAIQV